MVTESGGEVTVSSPFVAVAVLVTRPAVMSPKVMV